LARRQEKRKITSRLKALGEEFVLQSERRAWKNEAPSPTLSHLRGPQASLLSQPRSLQHRWLGFGENTREKIR